jgi:hypothetical protein
MAPSAYFQGILGKDVSSFSSLLNPKCETDSPKPLFTCLDISENTVNIFKVFSEKSHIYQNFCRFSGLKPLNRARLF